MINNTSSFPEVEFFPAEQFRKIGDRSGQPIWYVGKERGFGLPVVALHSDPVANDTEAIYLYELAKFDPASVNLTEDPTPPPPLSRMRNSKALPAITSASQGRPWVKVGG